ncbi:MAG TPA: transposase [candidate division WWE3 bacterium]|uniref:Transposase n=1 Tax=candidate division WWE3 bacterium TaxID=2053526 RepID=A0A7C1HVC3_UNCKA|nr:transposase [candidate division WWE3 bacterium]
MSKIKGTGPVKLKTIGWGISGYDDYMNFKSYIKTISRNQIIREKLNIIDFFDKYGAKATREAFRVSRSTVYLWKKRYKDSKYNPNSLIPKSTKPKHTRTMYVDPQILEFIKSLRKNHHRFGKTKIKSLLDEYCVKENLLTISESKIDKIIKRYNLNLPPPNAHKNKPKKKNRKRRSIQNKTTFSGEVVQIDTIVRYEAGLKLYIITAIDTYSRYGFAYTYKSHSSRTALDFMQKLQQVTPFDIKSVKTDNGSEFLGEFDSYLTRQNITHYFTYPNSPKSNGFVERFNRTLQEEFVDYNLEYIYNLNDFNAQLCEYLLFYNSIRPHYGINNLTPLGYLVSKCILSNMCASYTAIV